MFSILVHELAMFINSEHGKMLNRSGRMNKQTAIFIEGFLILVAQSKSDRTSIKFNKFHYDVNFYCHKNIF